MRARSVKPRFLPSKRIASVLPLSTPDRDSLHAAGPGEETRSAFGYERSGQALGRGRRGLRRARGIPGPEAGGHHPAPLVGSNLGEQEAQGARVPAARRPRRPAAAAARCRGGSRWPAPRADRAPALSSARGGRWWCSISSSPEGARMAGSGSSSAGQRRGIAEPRLEPAGLTSTTRCSFGAGSCAGLPGFLALRPSAP